MRKLFATVLCLAAGSAVWADSVWPGGYKSQGNYASTVADQRALEVGDLVTVQVSENASATQNVSTQTNKDANVSGMAGQASWTRYSGAQSDSWGVGGSESSSGGGTSARSGKLVATLSARVVSVLPNGNLYIEGRRVVQVNDEKQNMYISGIIRPKDVGYNNIVQSSAISDAQIRYEGRGPLAEKGRPGVATRLLDWLGIF